MCCGFQWLLVQMSDSLRKKKHRKTPCKPSNLLSPILGVCSNVPRLLLLWRKLSIVSPLQVQEMLGCSDYVELSDFCFARSKFIWCSYFCKLPTSLLKRVLLNVNFSFKSVRFINSVISRSLSVPSNFHEAPVTMWDELFKVRVTDVYISGLIIQVSLLPIANCEMEQQ